MDTNNKDAQHPAGHEQSNFGEQLKREYPLSGGETDEDLAAGFDALAHLISKEVLNTHFPLSGGETNHDLEEATGDDEDNENA